ncbi:MAG: hypothetical protein R2764_16405 [Bacteroidales bacterium]
MIKRYKSESGNNGGLVLSYNPEDGDQIEIKQDNEIIGIGPRWEILRISATIESQPQDSTFNAIIYTRVMRKFI